MSKTNYLQTVTSDLQRTAGPYRCAITGSQLISTTSSAILDKASRLHEQKSSAVLVTI
jgi:hypothetical protein